MNNNEHTSYNIFVKDEQPEGEYLHTIPQSQTLDDIAVNRAPSMCTQLACSQHSLLLSFMLVLPLPLSVSLSLSISVCVPPPRLSLCPSLSLSFSLTLTVQAIITSQADSIL